MEEQYEYKDNFLIPILRKKLNEASALAVEMEATIIYQNAKIKDLSEKLEAASMSNSSSPESPNVLASKIRKKQVSSSDGGTF